ncbi:hypothetical protein GCM10023143_09050 [Compostibacter hankyongensis]|uniref:DNA alkylation repair protein n=2 Tax=Compostibacter hankyongensis TaxID=1007089 RepID=A0ABP8FIR6_9BACT
MGYTYDQVKLSETIAQQIGRRSATSLQWLRQQQEKLLQGGKNNVFGVTFTAIPRFVDKGDAGLAEADADLFSELRNGFTPLHWPLDRLARAWWLLQLPAADEAYYVMQVESLFEAAAVQEQVALYSALPLLAYPEQFKLRAAEGIRTSLGDVFDAVALDNPYPSEYLEEGAWNQLVLKAFFMERPVKRIIGLEKRVNPELGRMLTDYAREREAAGRTVDPQLHQLAARCAGKQ